MNTICEQTRRESNEKELDRETNCKEVVYQITQKGRERINAKN